MWTLGALEERLSEYIFEIYDTGVHPALGQSPQEAFTAGLESGGLRCQRMIGYDEEFPDCNIPDDPQRCREGYSGSRREGEPDPLLVGSLSQPGRGRHACSGPL